jgi:hypothetical protein
VFCRPSFCLSRSYSLRVLIVPLVLTFAPDAVDARIWTDATGQNTVDAEFITVQFEKVWLRRSDGQVFGVDATNLSDADQEHVQTLMIARKNNVETTTNPAGRIAYGPGGIRSRLACERISESSGIACSRHHRDFFWTHNDSGDDARIYLFDADGRDKGICQLKDVFAFDWEDCFSFQRDGKNYLVFCDTGNNGRSAPIQVLYIVEEPPFDPQDGLKLREIAIVETIHYSYEDDHRDCEAVAVDPTSRTILMIAREREANCNVYALNWPKPDPTRAFMAKQIARLKIPFVTAMDISPDGRRAIVLTYRDAYEFVRGQDQTWARAFLQTPRKIVVPERVQGESICYGLDGQTLYLTSEKRPTPLLEIPVLP